MVCPSVVDPHPCRDMCSSIQEHLRELDVKACHTGRRVVAAAGTLLGGNDHVRATVLCILERARGWPVPVQ